MSAPPPATSASGTGEGSVPAAAAGPYAVPPEGYYPPFYFSHPAPYASHPHDAQGQSQGQAPPAAESVSSSGATNGHAAPQPPSQPPQPYFPLHPAVYPPYTQYPPGVVPYSQPPPQGGAASPPTTAAPADTVSKAAEPSEGGDKNKKRSRAGKSGGGDDGKRKKAKDSSSSSGNTGVVQANGLNGHGEAQSQATGPAADSPVESSFGHAAPVNGAVVSPV